MSIVFKFADSGTLPECSLYGSRLLRERYNQKDDMSIVTGNGYVKNIPHYIFN